MDHICKSLYKPSAFHVEELSIDTPMVRKIACIGSMLTLQSYLVLHDLTYYGTRDNEAILLRMYIN
jgi:hypothetical protein